eukprot:TRINITY_DN2625_c4_g1_i1.p1 TRINITY_DN2625_c4_g1~~TRINITY_DN2625_c4_g1_i1.p1  ORF type:complete len:141 (-),score=27.38 TRINITY_DN2625_c4_g1_i1:40-462(-)
MLILILLILLILSRTVPNNLGGPDNRYALSITAPGEFGFTSWGNKLPNASWIGQSYHSTGFPGIAPDTSTGPYRDTINWITYENGQDLMLRAFSISDLSGSYGDDGQNYKNIILVVKSIPGITFEENIIVGCGHFPTSQF